MATDEKHEPFDEIWKRTMMRLKKVEILAVFVAAVRERNDLLLHAKERLRNIARHDTKNPDCGKHCIEEIKAEAADTLARLEKLGC